MFIGRSMAKRQSISSSRHPSQQLILYRAASDKTCAVPRTHDTFGDRTFTAAVTARLCNRLTLAEEKRLLNTFGITYSSSAIHDFVSRLIQITSYSLYIYTNVHIFHLKSMPCHLKSHYSSINAGYYKDRSDSISGI